jgi:preprotein translocase subunit SecG
MGILFTILTVLDVLIAILIIALVLVQQSKSTGLGTTFGGGGSDSLFGAHAATHLSKLTVIFSTFFLVITLALAIMSGHQSKYNQSVSALDPLLTVQPSAPVKAEKQADIPKQAVQASKAVKTSTTKAVDKTKKPTK